VQGATSK